MPDGSRKVTAITEVMRMEGDVITTQDLFSFQIDEITAQRTVLGKLRNTGLRPTFISKLERHGVRLPGVDGAPSIAPVSGATIRGMAR